MNLKKFAIRGLVILAIFVALCMFFSGTVQTITTAKVKLIAGKRGKLEERTELAGKIAFPDTELIDLDLPSETTLTITQVNTRLGYTIKAGDIVLQAKVTNYDQAYKQFQDAYDQALEQLMTLESKNRDIRISQRDEQYAEAYYALLDARREVVNARMEAQALLMRAGMEAEDIEKNLEADSGYPENADEALKSAIDDCRAAAKAEAEAQQDMEDASRYSISENVWTYISERYTCQSKMKETEEGMQELALLNQSVQNLCAPHDGYIAEISLKEGDVYDGSKALYAITPEGKMPVLRADVSQIDRVVADGTVVTMNSDRYDAIETSVVTSGIDEEGKKYVDVQLTDQLIAACGSVFSMTMEETPLTLLYRAREATTLLPTSAVRGSGDDRYVYTVEQSSTAFGNTTMKLRKMPVTVLAESNGTASVQEDISYYTVAYMEDRPINDGDSVMEYLS